MKDAVIQVYKRNGTVDKRKQTVGDNCKPVSEYHDDFDYYLDVFETEAEADEFMAIEA